MHDKLILASFGDRNDDKLCCKQYVIGTRNFLKTYLLNFYQVVVLITSLQIMTMSVTILIGTNKEKLKVFKNKLCYLRFLSIFLTFNKLPAILYNIGN